MMKACLITLAIGLSTLTALAQEGLTKTQELKNDCDAYVAVQDQHDDGQARAADRCLAFVDGVMDESTGEMFFEDDTRTALVIGTWQGVTLNQQIRVFIKYVNANPGVMSKPAVQVMLKSAAAAKLYSLEPCEAGAGRDCGELKIISNSERLEHDK
jgi:Ssp1 endopeptidase immunity protein Rap1a